MQRRRVVLGMLFGVSLAAALAVRQATREPVEVAKATVDSNVLPADYVGPQACESCHEESARPWSRHAHRTMNQNATEQTVAGDFSGARISLPKGDAVFSREGGAFIMTLLRDEKVLRRYRVTRTVGSRFMQFYIGTQLEGPEPAGAPIYTVEQKLPFGYLFRWKRWLPHNFFDPLGPEHAADGSPVFDVFDKPVVHAWTQSCMQCHNTFPYAYRLGLVAPRQGYPVKDLAISRGLRDAVAKTLDLSKIPPNALATSTALVADRDLVTLGISCEACHFGGRAHVAAEGDASSWLPVSALLQINPRDARHSTGSDSKNPYVVNAICTQCHCAPADTYANGGGVSNSREALDLAAGACNPSIKCTDCHDAHDTAGPVGKPATQKHLDACLGCHPKYRAPAAAAAHGQHPAAAAVSCLDCHMPRVSQGLDQNVRTHTISSPADPRMLSSEQPNACNVCHLDKSIRWTVDQLATRWGKKLELAAPATDALDVPAGRAWLGAKSSFVRMAATQAWPGSPLARSDVGSLIRALEDTHAVNRVFAGLAVEQVLGRPLSVSDYDPAAAPATRAKQIERLLAQLH